jgi:hypothetical protein
MKNCLIVLVVLIVCFFVSAWLVLYPPWERGGRGAGGIPSGVPYMIATWQDFEDPGIRGLEVQVGTDEIVVQVPASPRFKSITQKGHWNLHAFYVDSNVDSPPEVMVAHELKNEDLEVDIGHFLPGHPGKIVCVKTFRIFDDRPPYPVKVPGQTVAYPPPKGLIRVGMLQCDLELLPWNADKIEIGEADSDVPPPESAGNGRIFVGPPPSPGDMGEGPRVYTYHSDRSDAPKLLVTVYHGRVTEVTGGAEETSDIPYQLPAPSPPAAETPPPPDRTWAAWLFNLIFTK